MSANPFIFLALFAAAALGFALAPLAIAVLLLGYWLWGMRADASPDAVQTLVGRLTLGMIPLDALLLLGSGHWLWAPALLVLMAPAVLARRRI